MKAEIDNLGIEVYGDDYPNFQKYTEQRKRGPVERVKSKPNRNWYPRFSSVQDKIDILNEIKGSSISNIVLEKLSSRYDNISMLKDYAKNRHQFIVGKGWWTDI